MSLGEWPRRFDGPWCLLLQVQSSATLTTEGKGTTHPPTRCQQTATSPLLRAPNIILTGRVVGGFCFKGDEISEAVNKKEILNKTSDVWRRAVQHVTWWTEGIRQVRGFSLSQRWLRGSPPFGKRPRADWWKIYCRTLGVNTVYFAWLIPALRRKLLPPSSGWLKWSRLTLN